jgi:hypothetical protein
MSSRLHRAALVAAVLGAAGALAGLAPVPANATSVQRPEDGSEYKKIIDSANDALVTVKFVMKAPDGQGGDSEEEISGVVIDPKGTVLCSYWFLGGGAAMFSAGASPQPQDIKVLIGDDIEGKKARLVSHDTDLDLAWIKLEEEPGAPLKFVDLDKGVAGDVGNRVFLLSRMDKYFDRAPIVNEGRIRGVASKPRKLLAPAQSLLSGRNDIGLPVFNADANIVGFMIIQTPDKESMQATENLGGPTPMILPVESVAKATKRAMEAQNDPNAEKKDEPAPTPAKETPKPAEPAK